ncbi:Gfo/Idh/MocA family protein [Protaetiibacter intestinalis]|uniref:Gfo/Idh/MocA family oxidoreductase n=1 Tax=Protaetiibacter intestinalis TaxID=2419774 RepID=A0A387B1B8_9MICO|nr:Gfo/Idh/MocA family oxidoreductase [Protaetiibacter intestinalis]AYF97312.1 gfo/Idh/MocA family oxidoreductase [Protaetiibacter intestinalis]
MPAPDGSLGVAAIGYAFMGKAHSGAWRNVGAYFDVPPVHRRLLVGRDAEAVGRAAARYGWDETATDWRSVLERDDVDIVDILTPGHLHAEIAIAALEAGKHVVVEKPLANTLAEAEAMAAAAAAAEARGQHAIVNFNYRRVPAIALAKELIDEGRIGAIRHVRASYLQDWLADPSSPMSWRLRKEQAGSGALGDLGAHIVDLVLHLTGDRIESLNGGMRTFVTRRPAGESGDGALGGSGGGGPLEEVTVDDAAWASAHLWGGGVAQLEVSRFAGGRKNGLRLELYGEHGSIAFDLERLNELEYFDARGDAGRQGFTRILVTESGHPWVNAWWPDGHIIGWEHSFTHQFAQLLGDIRDGRPSTPSFAEGLAVQRVLDAIERSAAHDGAATAP